jgi:hypothetical protein
MYTVTIMNSVAAFVFCALILRITRIEVKLSKDLYSAATRFVIFPIIFIGIVSIFISIVFNLDGFFVQAILEEIIKIRIVYHYYRSFRSGIILILLFALIESSIIKPFSIILYHHFFEIGSFSPSIFVSQNIALLLHVLLGYLYYIIILYKFHYNFFLIPILLHISYNVIVTSIYDRDLSLLLSATIFVAILCFFLFSIFFANKAVSKLQ